MTWGEIKEKIDSELEDDAEIHRIAIVDFNMWLKKKLYNIKIQIDLHIKNDSYSIYSIPKEDGNDD